MARSTRRQSTVECLDCKVVCGPDALCGCCIDIAEKRCIDCNHPTSLHNDEVGCTFQADTRYRCLCYFSPEMADAPTFDVAMAIRRAEKLERSA